MTITEDTLSLTFAALADPTRRAIMVRLSEGATTVMKLAEPFAMSLPAVSKHLKVLETAGLVSKGRDGQLRPCKLEGAPLQGAMDWIGQYKQHWEERLDRLDAHLLELHAKEKEHGFET